MIGINVTFYILQKGLFPFNIFNTFSKLLSACIADVI